MTRPHAKQIREAARLILEARRPVLYVGGGVIRAGAAKELKVLAELTGIPVVTTLMARGAFPDSHPQHLGMPGMHGTVAAVAGLQTSDLIISLGARFDDRVTGNLDSFAPDAKVIHADIDPAEIGKNRVADVPIVGDCPRGDRRPGRRARRPRPTPATGRLRGAGSTFLAGVKKTYPLGYDQPADGALAPQYVIERLGEDRRSGRDLRRRRRPAPDVGRALHRLREPGHLDQLRRPRHDGLRRAGRDGRQGRPAGHDRVGDRRRRLLPDDQPGARHLRDRGHPDQGRDHQQRVPRHGPAVADAVLQRALLQHRPATPSGSRTSSSWPRRTAASGCACESPDDVDATIDKAMEINDVPVVVDFRVHRDAMVWPMVAAGTSNDDIKFARDMAPEFDERLGPCEERSERDP